MKGRVTAYRQRSLAIGHYLNNNGATKASIVAEQTQQPKARDILYKNYYGWFAKVSRGVYKITPLGVKDISQWENQDS